MDRKKLSLQGDDAIGKAEEQRIKVSKKRSYRKNYLTA